MLINIVVAAVLTVFLLMPQAGTAQKTAIAIGGGGGGGVYFNALVPTYNSGWHTNRG
jgi:hypothetical protein